MRTEEEIKANVERLQDIWRIRIKEGMDVKCIEDVIWELNWVLEKH